MTWYREINPVQEPFSSGLHTDNKRVMWQFNINITKCPSDTILEELAKRIADNTTLTRGQDILLGSKVIVPEGDGPYCIVNTTGGAGPGWIHNSASPHMKNPSVQITVVALDDTVAEVMAYRVYDTLAEIRNADLNPS